MTTTTLDRTATAHGLIDEYKGFATLVESLDAKEWSTPTRCTGFEVRDVAGHVIGLAEDVIAGVPGTRNAEEEAASVRGDTPAQAAARLRAVVAGLEPLLGALDETAWNGPSGVPDLTFGRGVLVLWYDAYVHADDIRVAIGRASERGRGLAAAVEYLAGELELREWAPATLALDGTPRFDVRGGGREVTGDPHTFVMVATGRTEPHTMGLDPSVNIYA